MSHPALPTEKRQQRETLGWMYHMEGCFGHLMSAGRAPVLAELDGFLSTQFVWRRPPFTGLELQARVERVYRQGGGTLGDAVGYGKTCCSLALVAAP